MLQTDAFSTQASLPVYSLTIFFRQAKGSVGCWPARMGFMLVFTVVGVMVLVDGFFLSCWWLCTCMIVVDGLLAEKYINKKMKLPKGGVYYGFGIQLSFLFLVTLFILDGWSLWLGSILI